MKMAITPIYFIYVLASPKGSWKYSASICRAVYHSHEGRADGQNDCNPETEEKRGHQLLIVVFAHACKDIEGWLQLVII